MAPADPDGAHGVGAWLAAQRIQQFRRRALQRFCRALGARRDAGAAGADFRRSRICLPPAGLQSDDRESSIAQPGQYIRTNRGKPPGLAFLDDIAALPPLWLFEFSVTTTTQAPPTPSPIAILDPGWSLAIEQKGASALEVAFYYACMRPEELDPAWEWGETE